MGLFDNLSYAFSGSAPAGDPSSFSALENRRKIALAMLARDRKGYPKNVGEGLTAIGDAIGERSQLSQLDAQQAAYDKWNADHPPPSASSLMQQTQPPPAAAGPRADAGQAAAPAWLSGAQVAMAAPQVAASGSPFPDVAPQAVAEASPSLPPTAPQQDLSYPQTANNIPSDIISDVPDPGVQRASLPPIDPNVRARVAQTVQARQGVPPQNPLLGGGQSPAAMPPSVSPDPSLLGSPLEAEQNPPRPFKVAQAPGTAPSIPEINRVTPPVTMPPPGPVQQPPNARYNQMELRGADIEQWGNQRGDPRAIAQGQLLQKIGKEQRDRENADLQKKYEIDRQLENQRVLEQEKAQQGKGLAQQQLEEATTKAADLKRTNRFGGSVPYQQFIGDMSKSYDATHQLSSTLPTIQQAKQALAQSYTGKGAEIKLDANKMLRTLGVPGDYTPAVATELLQSRMKAIAGGMIKSTVGSQNISDADRDFVEAAYAGKISMEPESLRRLLSIAEDTTIRSINRHNDRLIGVAKHPDDSVIREQYQVPMQYGDAAVNYLKAHPDTKDAFDRKFGKGHAKAVLQGTPYGQ